MLKQEPGVPGSGRLVVALGMALTLGASAIAALASGASDPPATPAAPTQQQAKFFETRVRPLLAERCFACHGAARQSGGLRLDSRSSFARGSGGERLVMPEKPDQSLLLRAVRHEGPRMPPGGRLSDAEIGVLTEWVRQGAPWPEAPAVKPAATGSRQTGQVRKRAGADHWAFRPIRPLTPPPRMADGGWSRNAVDAFVWQKLKSERLTPAPEADRRALIRRLTFDLHGLPPTPEEVEAFVADPSADAYEKLVDRLLENPRFGERWARHWLDLVRYADSDGYRADEYRPLSFRYRDYVIRAFNQDKPYDRFVQEQLAGDELFPGDPEALVATGYLRHWIYEWNNRDVRGQWTTILNDLTDTTGDVFLGLGVQCARCHDHKFDPILQKDYFRLQAFFAPILPRDDLDTATPAEREAHRRQMAVWEGKTAAIRAELAELEAPLREKSAHEAITRFPPDIQAMILKPVAQRLPLEHQLAELAYRQVTYEYDHLETRFKGAAKEKWLELRRRLAQFDADKPDPLPAVFAATDVSKGAPPVLIPKKGKQPVAPGFLTVLDPRELSVPPLASSTGRRAELARWLTLPENPITARVIANRVWQYHFGRGLAANASDFGTLGEPPSHPELLDHLARWLASPSGGAPWSLKKLHRLIVTSAAYRQSTRHPMATAYRQRDPENRWLWRGSVRRLEAEQIRDSVLAVTGELDPRAGGPGVPSNEPRRTIYTRFMRNTRDPLLDVFDLPQFFTSASSRDTTTTPVQALLLVNSQTLLLRSEALAARLEREAGPEPAAQVTRAYHLLYGRPPRPNELAAGLKFLAEQPTRIRPEQLASAGAGFLHDRIPPRDGQAALMSPEGPQSRLQVDADPRFPRSDFTIEAYVLPRSVYETGAVRTIAARWNGDPKSPGWGFGITGKQSRRKPQTLVMQLVGKKAGGGVGEAALFSDHTLVINKPYYVAAAVRFAEGGTPGSVTFFVKDLANDDEPMRSATVSHSIEAIEAIEGPQPNGQPLTLGGRSGEMNALFDGLMDDIRLSKGALPLADLLLNSDAKNAGTVGFWRFESRPDVFGDSSGNGLTVRPASKARTIIEPQRAALADFCHVLLNSNEFLYVN